MFSITHPLQTWSTQAGTAGTRSIFLVILIEQLGKVTSLESNLA